MHNMQHFYLTLRWPLYDLESRISWFVIDTTIFSPDFESTKWDKSNEPTIIQIGQIEAEIFVISMFGSKPIDLYRKNMFFYFSSNVATALIH